LRTYEIRCNDKAHPLCSLTFCASVAGSLLTARRAIYLNKPFFTPLDRFFGPVWTTLHFLMAVSPWLIWKKGFHKSPVIIALALYLLQLVLNALWTPIFFGIDTRFCLAKTENNW
jgi:tryptophan-rich sensory protein